MREELGAPVVSQPRPLKEACAAANNSCRQAADVVELNKHVMRLRARASNVARGHASWLSLAYVSLTFDEHILIFQQKGNCV